MSYCCWFQYFLHLTLDFENCSYKMRSIPLENFDDIVTNLGPPAHLSIFLPPPGTLVRMHRATSCSFGRNIRPLWCMDCVTIVRLTLSHLSPPWTRRHHFTNSDLIHAKLLYIHTQENITIVTQKNHPVTLHHTALKRQNFCDQITVIWNFNSDFGKLNWITVYAIQSV